MSVSRKLVVAATTLVLTTVLSAQSDPGAARQASEARERLAFLVGAWTVEGMEDSFTETCDWYDNRAHVVCNAEIVTPAGLQKSVSVFSYSERRGRYAYYHYGSSGVVNEMDVFLVDDSLLATYERQLGGDLVREQVSMTPRGDGSYDFREDNSRNGGPWETITSIHYIPKPPATK